MPGTESLQQQQYYAHPRNAFWLIMTALFNLNKTLNYQERLNRLKQHQVSLWDVLENCVRPGSLDNNIVAATETANNLNNFQQRHPELKAIAFNGRKARDSFTRHFLRQDKRSWQNLTLLDLPSTSPAHAALRPAEKLKIWQDHLEPFLTPS